MTAAEQSPENHNEQPTHTAAASSRRQKWLQDKEAHGGGGCCHTAALAAEGSAQGTCMVSNVRASSFPGHVSVTHKLQDNTATASADIVVREPAFLPLPWNLSQHFRAAATAHHLTLAAHVAEHSRLG
eukprot:GHRQ01030138.1.p2 GENE.GHRQ01030138.1~~GHRQ01030138.1.p2  ORF type:complete len:128 (-),score=14.52 GHRQ01030138.1:817-1200(-)